MSKICQNCGKEQAFSDEILCSSCYTAYEQGRETVVDHERAHPKAANETRVEGRAKQFEETRLEQGENSQGNNVPERNVDWSRQFPDGFKGFTSGGYIGGGGEADVFLIEGENDRKVMKVYRISPSHQEVAKKVMHLSQSHPDCFVEILECGYDAALNGTSYEWYEIQEYMENGSLEKFIQEAGDGFFTKEIIKTLISQVTASLEVLDSERIVHQDLKPANILIKSLNPFKVVVSDFGLVTMLIDKNTRFTNRKGTQYYSSPELLLSQASLKTDFWSLGIIVYELLTGANPFKALKTPEEILSRIIKGIRLPDRNDLIDDSFILLLKGLLTGHGNREKRWGCDEIRSWFAGKEVPEYFAGSFSDGDVTPFPLDGRHFTDVQSIINYCADNPANWKNGVGKLLRDPSVIRQWMVKNSMLDCVEKVDKILEMNVSKNEAFFHFVYTFHPELPDFRYMGKTINLNNLQLYLGKELRGEPQDESAGEIVRAMGDGTLARLHAAYQMLTKRKESRMQDFFENLKGKNYPEHVEIFLALGKWQKSQSSVWNKARGFMSLFAAVLAMSGIAFGLWSLQDYFIKTRGIASVVYNYISFMKLSILTGEQLNYFRIAHAASATLFLFLTFFVWNSRRKKGSSKQKLTQELPLNLQLAIFVNRPDRAPSFYKRLKYIAFALLLIPAILVFYLTTEVRLRAYADEGNQKAIAYLQEQERKAASSRSSAASLRQSSTADSTSTSSSRAASAPQTATSQSAAPQFIGIVTGDRVNIRRGPSTQTASLGMVNRNFRVEVMEEGREWHKIRYTDANGGRREGYMSAQFVQRDGIAANSSNTPAAAPPTPAPAAPVSAASNISETTTTTTATPTPPATPPADNARYDQLMSEAGQFEQVGDLSNALAKYKEAQLIKDSMELRTIIGNVDGALRLQNEQTSLAEDFEKEGDRLAGLGNYRGAQTQYCRSLAIAANPRVDDKLKNMVNLERAESLSNEGDAFMNARNYDAAIMKYQESLSLVNNPVVGDKLKTAQIAKEDAQKTSDAVLGIAGGILNEVLKKR